VPLKAIHCLLRLTLKQPAATQENKRNGVMPYLTGGIETFRDRCTMRPLYAVFSVRFLAMPNRIGVGVNRAECRA